MNKANKNLKELFPSIDPKKLDSKPELLGIIRNIANRLKTLDGVCGGCSPVTEEGVSKLVEPLYSSLFRLKLSGYENFDKIKLEVDQVRAQCYYYKDIFEEVASQYSF